MNSQNVAIIKLKNVLLVSISADPDEETIKRLQDDILEKIRATKVRGLILDISTTEMPDSYFARSIIKTAQVVGLMGTRTVVVGMPPRVAQAATQLGLVLTVLETALSVDNAFAMLTGD